MRVATLSIGDELMVGENLDSNSQRLAVAIAHRGWQHAGHRIVADSIADISSAISQSIDSADMLICTGGLGPTLDDITRDALAEVMGESLIRDSQAEDTIRGFFKERGYDMPESNIRQAMRPSSATILENRLGTAPGLSVVCNGVKIILLPGPPREMEPMLESVLERATQPVRVRIVRAFGIGESSAAEGIEDLMARDGEPRVGITVSNSLLAARIRAFDPHTPDDELDAIVSRIREAWSPWSFGEDDACLERAVVDLLRDRNLTLATAESCSGGLIGNMLTNVPGSSDCYPGGWITYENRRKIEDLGVSADIIERDGAVSESVACAMAKGARIKSGSDIAVSTTGIAGPGGGTSDKPVGWVWIAVSDKDGESARLFRYPGNRDLVRDRTAKSALQCVRFRVMGVRAPLLWQDRNE